MAQTQRTIHTLNNEKSLQEAPLKEFFQYRKPLVSVIIPLYNNELLIEKALKSVIEQSDSEIELIVIDGGSTDNSWSIVQSYKNYISYSIREPDKGIYDAMNKGIGISNGEWIYFLGSDDVLEPNIITQIKPHLSSDYVLVYGDVRFSNGRKFSSMFSLRTFLQNTIHHQGAFYNKIMFKEFRYNINFRILSDYELNLIIYRRKLPVKKLDKIIATCWVGGKSSSVSLAVEETNLIRSKHIQSKFINSILSSSLKMYYIQKRIRSIIVKGGKN
jgi:putative colanic acid biosynthesis glycosyltransferase